MNFLYTRGVFALGQLMEERANSQEIRSDEVSPQRMCCYLDLFQWQIFCNLAGKVISLELLRALGLFLWSIRYY